VHYYAAQFFLPFHFVERWQTDKPWVNDRFRRLIRCRQHAWSSEDRSSYNKQLNQVNQLSKRLHSQLYHRRIEGLCSSNPHHQWRHTKQLIGQQVKSQLQTLINDTAGGDVQLLVNLINNALLQVSIDLERLSSENIFQSEEIYATYFHMLQPTNRRGRMKSWTGFWKTLPLLLLIQCATFLMRSSLVDWCQMSEREWM